MTITFKIWVYCSKFLYAIDTFIKKFVFLCVDVCFPVDTCMQVKGVFLPNPHPTPEIKVLYEP